MKRIISLLLVFALLLGDAAPFVAATETAEATAVTEETTVPTTEATEAAETTQATTAPEETVPETTEAVTEPETTVTTEPTHEVELEETSEAKNATSGTCGDNLTWTLDDSGTLTVSGTGDMHAYYTSNNDPAPWDGSKDSIKKVIIANGVTTVCDFAFSECVNLKTVVLANSVTDVGIFAFSYCDSLTDLTLSAGMEEINASFSYNNSLVSVMIPSGVKRIGNEAFEANYNMTTVYIPLTVTEIWLYAFYDLIEVYYEGSAEDWAKIEGDGVPDPADHTFHYNYVYPAASIASGTCGDNLTWSLDDAGTLTISGTGAMDDYNSTGTPWYSSRSAITSVVIETGVTSIGEYAFYYCSNLTSVTIPEGITYIGKKALAYCSSLTSVELPESLTEIGDEAFERCTKLNSIGFPDNLEIIGYCAFENCDRLTTVIIPGNVSSTEYSFADCDNLTEIHVSSSNRTYASVNGVLYNWELTEVLEYPAGRSGNYEIREGTTTVGAYAFADCKKLTNVVIPEGVTVIDWGAFSYCEQLAAVTIPSTVTYIWANAFYNCTALKDVIYNASEENWSKINIYGGNDSLINANIQYSNSSEPAEPKTFVVHYDLTDPAVNGTGVVYRTFDEEYFNQDSSVYNHDLARLSLGMCMTAVTHEEVNSFGELYYPSGEPDAYVREFMENIGCTEFYSKKFDDNTSTDDSCAYAYGLKHLESSDTYLIPVVIRGFGYGEGFNGEWVSNFHVVEKGYETYAAGFRISAEKVYADLSAYINQVIASGVNAADLKIWISGYSRAGAIANNLGYLFFANGSIYQKNTFVYTFATPNTVNKGNAVAISGIFNIVSETDIVPRVPLSSWDYGRFGTTYYLPTHTRFGTGYMEFFNRVAANFTAHMELNGITSSNIMGYYYSQYASQELAIDLLIDYLDDWVETSARYESYGVQEALMIALGKETDYDTFLSFLYAILPEYETLVTDFLDFVENANQLSAGEFESQRNQLLKDLGNAIVGTAATEDHVKELLIILKVLTVRYGFANKDKETIYNTMFDMLGTVIKYGHTSNLLKQHWSESYLAWMELPQIILDKYSYNKVSVKCPVDIIVYNSAGTVVGRVVNDVVDESFDARLCIAVDEFGEKEIYLPEDDTYRIVVTAREAGELDIVVNSYDADGNCTGVDCYVDLSMEAAQVFEIGASGDTVTTEGTTLSPDASVSGEPTQITVSLTQNLDGIAIGDGTYDLGESVDMIAMDNETYGFDGWYQDGMLLSEEDGYTFSAMENVTIEAKFHEHSYGSWQHRDDGMYHRSCEACGYEQTQETKSGDLNADSVTDVQDISHLVWHLLFAETFPLTNDADFDCDGDVDLADAELLLWHVLFPESNPL